MRRIISFDLDMTLLDHGTYTIPDSALKAVSALKAGGNLIVLATGRDMDNHYSRTFRDQVDADAIIHLNGTKITVGDQRIYDHRMDLNLLERLLDFAQEYDYAVGITVGDEDYYVHPEQVIAHDKTRWGQLSRQFKDPRQLLHMGVRTMSYIGSPEGAAVLEAEFPEVKVPLFAGLMGADIIEREASKAVGLEMLCRHFDIPMEDSIAFGDSMNDYEIVKAAGIGIAMGNAIPQLKQAADYVTAAIGDDGIWKACGHFNLL